MRIKVSRHWNTGSKTVVFKTSRPSTTWWHAAQYPGGMCMVAKAILRFSKRERQRTDVQNCIFLGKAERDLLFYARLLQYGEDWKRWFELEPTLFTRMK